ncbi:Glycine cleavage system H protein [archaeon HR01]|nr:Glycine cleavage system H protein [archaeon HR01]
MQYDCQLPGDRLYHVGRDIWFQPAGGRFYRVGVTQPLCLMAGYFTTVRPRPVNTFIRRDTPIALIVSRKYEGALITPADVKIVGINESVLENPRIVCIDPYGSGWLAEVEIQEDPGAAGLVESSRAETLYREKNQRNGIVCLKVVPDYSRKIFGESCNMILTEIGDFMEKYVGRGETLHVITKDPVTEPDLLNMATTHGYQIVDLGRAGDLIHVIFRKS